MDLDTFQMSTESKGASSKDSSNKCCTNAVLLREPPCAEEAKENLPAAVTTVTT